MNNFRVFYGTQIIEFNDDFNVIVGANGTGKTSIIEAVNWCLYEISRSSILNFKVADEGGEKAVSVKCKFEDEGNMVLIKREVSFDGENNLKSKKFHVILNDVVIENPNYFIDNKFSRHLYDLTKTSLDENTNSLKHIVAKEFGIEDLQSVKAHLNNVMKRYLKDLSEVNPKMLNSISSIEKKLMDLSNNIELTNAKIKEVEKKIHNKRNIVKGLPDVQPFMIEKEMLKYKLDEVSKEIEYQENNLTSLLIDNVPLSMVNSKIMSDESVDFNEIETLLYKHFPTSDLLIKETHIDEIKDSFEKIRILYGEYEDLTFKINEINSKLELYSDAPFDELKKLDKIRKKLIHEKYLLSDDKKYLMIELKKLSDMEVLYEELPDIEGRIDFIEKAIFSIDKLISDINDSVQIDLINSIRKYFSDNSFSDYDELIIDDYKISFIKLGFKINSYDLSTAERELLRLSLVLSIYDLANNNVPLILDTPFMLLDSENRELMINMLKNVDVQKILLLSTYESSNLSTDYKLDVENGRVVILNGE